jgi:hypothetical protein
LGYLFVSLSASFVSLVLDDDARRLHSTSFVVIALSFPGSSKTVLVSSTTFCKLNTFYSTPGVRRNSQAVRSPNGAPINRLLYPRQETKLEASCTLSDRPWRPPCHPTAARRSFKLSRSPSMTITGLYIYPFYLKQQEEMDNQGEESQGVEETHGDHAWLFHRSQPRVL